ncbi:MAG: LuxR C-terminal-related transcriptional regulator [Tannerellaceae bacterium]|nr:LuxR C-terminal-related transcriptional regulator [Tannerellaceae bacterium]MCD7915520.1 LuxR C-terminal-related transcriptional regulator [Tannerellaceae bacterium]
MKTFILADNQDISRIGISYLIQDVCPTGEIIEELSSLGKLESILQRYPEAIVIIDIALSPFMEEKVLKQFHTAHPEVHWIIFSEDMSESLLSDYCTNSHFSFVLKKCEANEILLAVKYALKKENFICNPIIRLLMHFRKKTKPCKEALTPTETEVLKLIAIGKSAKEIACERHSSVYTIITHKKTSSVNWKSGTYTMLPNMHSGQD